MLLARSPTLCLGCPVPSTQPPYGAWGKFLLPADSTGQGPKSDTHDTGSFVTLSLSGLSLSSWLLALLMEATEAPAFQFPVGQQEGSRDRATAPGEARLLLTSWFQPGLGLFPASVYCL